MNGLEINMSITNHFDLHNLKIWSIFCLLLFTDRKVNKEEKQPCALVTKAYYFSEKKILKVFIASN